MLRIIFILLFVYLCVIIVRRMLFPKPGAKTNTRFYYQKYSSRQGSPTGDNRAQARKNLEQIEDADFEIIDEKDKEEEKRKN
ncbi:MAG: hypothetical protein EA364_01690 [Balneolaceae bacterium]|nr:MAG: hypothetical protein EA364_01690 [Balneolaceae bacterium]